LKEAVHVVQVEDLRVGRGHHGAAPGGAALRASFAGGGAASGRLSLLLAGGLGRQRFSGICRGLWFGFWAA